MLTVTSGQTVVRRRSTGFVDRRIRTIRHDETPLTLTRQSALTDFLASHNISAHQISSDYQRRLREAEERGESNADLQDDDDDNDNKENESGGEDEDVVERKKRKRKEEKQLMKIKQSKEFKRRKHEHQEEYGSDADDDEIARHMLAKAKPLPGQFENCEICEKRFTVTPYSKTGPGGGLLCTKCSKEWKDDEKKKEAQAKKRAVVRGRRRQAESDRMMGDVKPGAKSLVEACVRRVADVVHDIDEFGDMPQNLLDRLSQILSQKRVLTSRTLGLFLKPDVDRIAIYDCGKLEEEDFHKIFAYMPHVESVNLRFAGQMKDDALLYMAEKCKKIRSLQLGATNLISDKAFVDMFRQRGSQLESLKLSELNDSLKDETVHEMVRCCANLRRLKLRSCSHMGEASIQSFAALSKLEHLTLAVAQNDTSSDTLVRLITNIGPHLQTLCLEGFVEADDAVLEAIKNHCTKLRKLRLTGSTMCTDRAFADLFGNNFGNPPIPYIDLSDNRDVDSMNPDGPQEEPVGFGSEAFKAMMLHSADRLERLDLHSCRHISHQALTEVFDGQKKYPCLQDIDLSFVTMVDEEVMAGIFRSCPALAKLAVFACFNARQARIPAGIAVIGLPNAHDNILIEGGGL